MSRPSKIDRLPEEVRDKIGALRDSGYTIDEIMAHLAAMPIDPGELPSRSGLHRHVQGLDKIASKLQRSRAVAEALVRKIGDAPENRQTRLNIELMHSVITDLVMEDEGSEVTFDPEQVMLLAKSLDHLSRASKSDADLQLRLRAEIEKKTKIAAVAAAETVGREKGLSGDTIAAIKAQILGVRVAA